ncbi:MAG TPA: TatD family hydrolase [Candidatus Heimdallarchaeota archaeon]|nr:TatD family hydrolase [Candidatus Heimdallarchaeota archaeon]
MTASFRLIDTHAHLDASDYRDDRGTVIARAFSSSIGVITVGVDRHSSETACHLARRHHLVWAAIGVHPHDAKTLDQTLLANLEDLAQNERVVAIGEVGLDYYRDLSPRNVQRRVFREQIALAQKSDLPIIVHNRDSTDDLLAILTELSSSHRGVIHSFLGSATLADAFLCLGFHLGIGGPITFTKNEKLKEAVRHIPLERILLETDCPYLTPVPHRGKRNEPAYVQYVAEAVAEIKGVSLKQVQQATSDNARRLFQL